MARVDFFAEPTPESRTKAEIVSNYFVAWAKIISTRANVERIGYIDLYAGPGRYEDGTDTTPILVMEKALSEPSVATRLVSVFNDSEPQVAEALDAALRGLEGIAQLPVEPSVSVSEVDAALVERFEDIQRMIPSLTFIDPWGYKGLTSRLIHRVVNDWGCEAIFFFNYNRINAAINNKSVEHLMLELFGAARLSDLRERVDGLHPRDRPSVVFDALFDLLHELGGSHPVDFRFRRANGRISHALIHVTKHPLGYSIMKEIMAKRGYIAPDGVPTFEYRPEGLQLPLSEDASLEGLKDELLERFRGDTLTRQRVYELHHIGRPYIEANYRRALLELEEAGLVACNPPASERRVGTIAVHVAITFP